MRNPGASIHVLGYGVREPPSAQAARPRSPSILCPQKAAVLTTETSIWWTAPGVEPGPDDQTKWFSYPALCYDFRYLLDKLRVSTDAPEGVVIAVTCDPCDTGDLHGVPRHHFTTDDSIWNFEGFDVSDRDLYSHLSGVCGVRFSPTELAALCDNLNDNHLFDDRVRADEFRDHVNANSAASEHLPAFVLGVWTCQAEWAFLRDDPA